MIDEVKFVNLTPHEIVVMGEPEVRVPPSGDVARVSVVTEPLGSIGGVPAFIERSGPVEGLPEPRDGVIYIVSTLVRVAVPRRVDVASPGQLVRDPDGRPVGCRGLVYNRLSSCPICGGELVHVAIGSYCSRCHMDTPPAGYKPGNVEAKKAADDYPPGVQYYARNVRWQDVGNVLDFIYSAYIEGWAAAVKEKMVPPKVPYIFPWSDEVGEAVAGMWAVQSHSEAVRSVYEAYCRGLRDGRAAWPKEVEAPYIFWKVTALRDHALRVLEEGRPDEEVIRAFEDAREGWEELSWWLEDVLKVVHKECEILLEGGPEALRRIDG